MHFKSGAINTFFPFSKKNLFQQITKKTSNKRTCRRSTQFHKTDRKKIEKFDPQHQQNLHNFWNFFETFPLCVRERKRERRWDLIKTPNVWRGEKCHQLFFLATKTTLKRETPHPLICIDGRRFFSLFWGFFFDKYPWSFFLFIGAFLKGIHERFFLSPPLLSPLVKADKKEERGKKLKMVGVSRSLDAKWPGGWMKIRWPHTKKRERERKSAWPDALFDKKWHLKRLDVSSKMTISQKFAYVPCTACQCTFLEQKFLQNCPKVCPPNQQRTLNKLPTELRRRNFVNKRRLSMQIGAQTC